MFNRHDFASSPWWNLLLITLGAFVFSFGVKSIIVHHNFINGGIFGTSLLIFYKTNLLSPGILYALINIPFFLLGYFKMSGRFVLYSLFSVAMTSLFTQFLNTDLQVENQIYAAIAGGVITGFGVGITLHSLGSTGGLDVLAILFHQKYNTSIGKFYFCYNAVLFTIAASQLHIDLVIASVLMVFISSTTIDYVLSMFSQQKMVFIISNRSEEITQIIINDLKKGATILNARGAYTNAEKQLILTVTNNMLLKRLEESVFTIDPDAMFIVENTFRVIGLGFSKRKVY
jgi:uncharacterized membrane-anchored protein YitT (DUF2179 family)